MPRRIHIFYSGTVQGVGFRFTTQDIARDLGVFGWVKNLSDGRVEAVAEAEESALKDFLSHIERYFKRYIRDVDIQWEESAKDKEFMDFSIRF